MWNRFKVFIGLLPAFKKGDVLHYYSDLELEFTSPRKIEILEVGKRCYLYKFCGGSNVAREAKFDFIHSLYYKP